MLSPSRERPCSSAKLASAISPSVAVLPLLKDPVMVPSEPMLKLCRVPLAAPSCWMEVVLLAAAVCVMSPVPVASNSFQVKVSGLAPSAKTEAGVVVGGILMVGLVVEAVPEVGVSLWRVPSPLKTRVPLARETGAVAPEMSAAGMVTP